MSIRRPARLALLSALAPAVAAAQFNIPDGDVPALIGAINQANSTPGPNTINLAANGMYTLTQVNNSGQLGANGLPPILSQITLNGNGAAIQRSSGAPGFRILFVDESGDLAINDLIIRGGMSSAEGGGIVNLGTLTAIGAEIAANRGPSDMREGGGGGISNIGTATLINCTIRDNWSGVAGGIENWGTLTLADSTISDNGATDEFHGNGGGIFNTGPLTVKNTTISGNSAQVVGGGAFLRIGGVTLTNCTISTNRARGGGSGIYAAGVLLHVSNSIIANNPGGDITGAYTDAGHNIVQDGSGITHPTSFAADPLLGPLADNGGPTLTHALLAASPAIDAGDCAAGATTHDQRGVPRPQGNACDIGAFELDCYPDCDGNGILDFLDFLCFQNASLAGDPYADCDGNQTLDFFDFLCFQNEFLAGCP